jgi:hypothetical protein
LWIFGIFASIFTSSGAGSIQLLTNNYSILQDQPSQVQNLQSLYSSKALEGVVSNVWTFLIHPNTTSVLALSGIAILFVIFIWLSIACQGALINGASQLSTGKPTRVEDDFKIGNQKFLPLLGLQAMAKLAIYGSLLIIGTPLLQFYLAKGYEILPLLFSLLSFIVLLPVSLIIYFILIFASIFVVVEKLPIIKSVERAWHLFKNNWLACLEFSILLFLINLIIGFAMVIVFVVPLLVMVYSAISISYMLFSTIVILSIVLIIMGGLTTFQFVATVNFVKEIGATSTPSRIIGFLHRLFTRKKQLL